MNKLWTVALLATMALPLAAQESGPQDELRGKLESVVTQIEGMTLLDMIEGGLASVVICSTEGECPGMPEGTAFSGQMLQFSDLSPDLQATLIDLLDGDGGAVEWSSMGEFLPLESESCPESE